MVIQWTNGGFARMAQIIDFIMSAKCLRRADGSVEYFVGLVQDITERKRAEEKLRRSEAYLAEGQKISQTGTWAVNFPLRRFMVTGNVSHLRPRSRRNEAFSTDRFWTVFTPRIARPCERRSTARFAQKRIRA